MEDTSEDFDTQDDLFANLIERTDYLFYNGITNEAQPLGIELLDDWTTALLDTGMFSVGDPLIDTLLTLRDHLNETAVEPDTIETLLNELIGHTQETIRRYPVAAAKADVSVVLETLTDIWTELKNK